MASKVIELVKYCWKDPFMRQLIKSWGLFIGAIVVARQLAEASDAAAVELANPVPA